MRRVLAVVCLLCGPQCVDALAAVRAEGNLRVDVRSAASGAPIAGARIAVDGQDAGVVTDSGGIARVSGLPAGPAMVRVSAHEFRPAQAVIDIARSEAMLHVVLAPVELRVDESVIVSAARADRAASDVPRSTAVVSRTALDERADRTSPEALQDRSGGWVQKTNHGGGSPFLRGLVGNQVLVLIDGVRLNNATFRLGPNQYMNTIDAFSLERIEVVRGSGSVQYGSDALGGVINLISPLPILSPGGVRAGGSVATRLASAGMEQTARAEGRVAGARAGVRGGVTLRNFGDLVAGGSLGTEAPSGYQESDADVSAIWAPSPRTTFTGVFQSVYQEGVPRFDQVSQRGYDVYEFDPQSRRLGYLQWQQLVSSKWLDLSRVTLSWQRSDEGRRRRRTGSDLETTESDTVATVGVSADLYGRLASRAGWHAGVEVYHDTVRSWRLDTDLATGASKPMRGLYPDGATRLSAAAFALGHFSFGRAGVDVGARYTRDDVEADDPVFGPLRIEPDAIVGSVSVLVPLGRGVQAFGSVAQAFRAPNIDDLSTLGTFDYGVEVPPESLDPERSVSIEGGLKANTSRVAATFAAFRLQLRDLIDRLPATFEGSPSWDGQDVYQRANVGEAYVRGLEADAEWRATAALTVRGFVASTYGQQVTVDAPMRRIPPVNGLLGARYRWNRGVWIEGTLRAAGAQTRLAPGDIADHRIPPGGTPGWSVVNLTAGMRVGQGLLLSAGLANLFDEAYRIHGSGIDGPGRHAWLSARFEF
ncbi:MAG: TonB-dependent receptor [Vicinamibacterales bacterium]|jgi:outer membrane receptor protein involved in Fe transport|nr:TonB-dependent receptor [Vicinamibacterales bacterium]